MAQIAILLDGQIIKCSWCKEALGTYPNINAENIYQQDHYTKGQCEIVFNEDEAIEEWRLERSFNGTGE